MQLIKKFYAPTPASGGPQGPSDGDVRNAENIKDTFARLKTDLIDIASILKTELTAGIAGFDRVSKKAANESIRSLEGELKRAAKAVDKTRQSQEGLTKQFTSSKKIQENINAIKSRQASIDNTILQLERQGLVLTQKQQTTVDDINNTLSEQVRIEEQLATAAAKREKAAGKIGALFEGISKIPVLNKLVDSRDILDKINKSAEETGSRWKAFGAGIKGVFSSIAKSLTDPVTILTGMFSLLKGIVDLVMDFNKRTFDIAKDLGVTVNEAEKLQKTFIEVANNSANFGVTSKEVAATYSGITKSLGFMVSANSELVDTAVLIQKRTGASAEDMESLARQSAITGKTLKQTYGTIEASRQIEGARNKLSMSTKQIMDGIAKVSQTVVINLKGSTKALADGVIRATKLGTTLDQVNKQGESLLDFESSISKEFEAQLLTGRDINLTRARELALNGKTADLMEELNNQQVTYDTFMNQNVIARKAEAEAIGLSVEELSKQLLLRKQAEQLGAKEGQSLQDRYNELVKSGATEDEIATKLGDKQAAADLAKAAMADKFQAAIEKLKDTIASMLEGPVGQMINSLADWISKGENIKMIGNALKSVFSKVGDIIQNFPQYLAKALPYLKLIGGVMLGIMSASIIASLSAIPVVGPALGFAAAIAAAAALVSLMNVQAPSFSAPSTSGGASESMTQPVSPVAATTAQATQTAAQPAPIFKFNVQTNVGTENWSKQTRTSLSQDSGMTIS